MFMKSTFASTISALLIVAASGSAYAETSKADLAKKNVDHITCEEFNGLSATVKPTVVAWAAGYRSGDTKPDSVVVDVEGIERVTPFVVAACQAEPKASFWSKVDTEMKKIF